MFSWHRDQKNLGKGACFHQGFETADVSIDRMAKCIVNYAWSPAVWKDGVRGKHNFLRADWYALDFDSGDLLLEDACNLWCDMVHIIGTTKSHQINKGGLIADRFRVVVKLEKTITSLNHYEYFMGEILKRVLEADKACLDGARYFWPCKEIVSLSSEGYVEEVPEVFERELNKKQNRITAKDLGYTASGILNPWAKAQLERDIPVGERTVTCHRIAKDLLKIGKSFDETLQIILNSKTYGGAVSTEVYKKIFQAVQSAERAVQRTRELGAATPSSYDTQRL
jgi:hypothetical protein